MKKQYFSLFFLGIFLTACQGNTTTPTQTNNSVSTGTIVVQSGASQNAIQNGVSLANLQTGGNQESLSDEDKSQYGDLAKLSLDSGSCDEQYANLIKVFGNDYSSCFAKRKQNATCNANAPQSKVNIAIIFDDSGSMKAKIGSESMIDMAKEEVTKYIKSLDNSIGGAVFVYGHKGNSTAGEKNNSCTGIENFGNFSDKNALVSKISALNASGWTPIDASLQEAKKYLDSISGENDQKIIMLVSDGKETCDGNPVETAKKIASSKNTYIDVIGFNVYGDTQSQLAEIAKNGGGKYSNVRSRIDFQKVFNDMQAFSDEVKCSATQASIALRSAVDGLNSYYTCDYLLHDEQVKVLTHMTPNCDTQVEALLQKRSQEIKTELE